MQIDNAVVFFLHITWKVTRQVIMILLLAILFTLFPILRCVRAASSSSTSLSLSLVPLDFPILTSPIFKLRCLQQGCGRREASNCPYIHPIAPPDFTLPHSHLGNNIDIHTEICDLYERIDIHPHRLLYI